MPSKVWDKITCHGQFIFCSVRQVSVWLLQLLLKPRFAHTNYSLLSLNGLAFFLPSCFVNKCPNMSIFSHTPYEYILHEEPSYKKNACRQPVPETRPAFPAQLMLKSKACHLKRRWITIIPYLNKRICFDKSKWQVTCIQVLSLTNDVVYIRPKHGHNSLSLCSL